MNCKLWVIICCISLSLTVNAQQTDGSKPFELEGSIELITTPVAYLIYSAGGKLVRDTANVNNGAFRFTGTIDGPTYSQLWSDDYKYGIALYLEGNKMTVELAGADKHILVTGSATEKEYAPLRQEYTMYNFKANQLLQEVAALKNTDPAAAVRKESEEGTVLKSELISAIKFFIREHPKSYVSIQELTTLAPILDNEELQRLFEGLDNALRQTEQGKAIAQKLEAVRLTGIGMPAPDFVQKDQVGHDIALHDFKGKYVLIDFWASWCGPCRVENPALVQAYKKFKNKNFMILGVSLDDNSEKWMAAIKKEGLNWLQVSDLKGWRNAVALQFGVSSIPANFLVDPNGTIIAKDLRGEALEQQLKKILK